MTAPRGVTLLGREPAAWVGLIEAVLATALLLGLLEPIGLKTAVEVGIFMAVVNAALGCYVAYATRQTSVGVIVGLVKACIALAAVYGLELSADLTASLILLTNVVFAFVNRQMADPLADVVRGEVVEVPATVEVPVEGAAGAATEAGPVRGRDVTGQSPSIRKPYA